MSAVTPLHIHTIGEYHRLTGLPKPEHPLISVIDVNDIQHPPAGNGIRLIYDFYSVSLKKFGDVTYRYGQQTYDFDNGVLFFMAPGQVFNIETNNDAAHTVTGWKILIHPDFLWNTSLVTTIRQYEYFGYAVNEALHLSEKEEATIAAIIKFMQQEYHTGIDNFSQSVLIAQLELILNYADRFYQRQFVTRKIAHHDILIRLENLLDTYFNSDAPPNQGLPTVNYIAGQLNISPNYLSGLIKTLTGQSTQEHLHNKLIALAKEKLSTTNLTVSEIAYDLGFQHLQSFSKLFKTKTNQSPQEFRSGFS